MTLNSGITVTLGHFPGTKVGMLLVLQGSTWPKWAKREITAMMDIIFPTVESWSSATQNLLECTSGFHLLLIKLVE